MRVKIVRTVAAALVQQACLPVAPQGPPPLPGNYSLASPRTFELYLFVYFFNVTILYSTHATFKFFDSVLPENIWPKTRV